MKLDKKHKAIALRKEGSSITVIADCLGVAKSSVSLWVRDVPLSKSTLEKIRKRSHTAAAVEKRRESRLMKSTLERSSKIKSAMKQVQLRTKNELFLVGIALYWGEGSKKKRGMVEFTNSDPEMIKVMRKFLDEVCLVKSEKYRGHVYLHSHLEPRIAEMYWSSVSGIPVSQFHKTSIQHNKNRIQKDTLPYGTFAIVVCDTNLKTNIDGWIQGLQNAIK